MHEGSNLFVKTYLFFIIIITVDLIIVLICISLMVNSIEYFSVLISHLYIFTGEVSIQIISSFFPLSC